MALKTTSFAEYIMHDAELISDRVRGLLTNENEALEKKHRLASIAAEYREALLAFEADARASASNGEPIILNMLDLELNPQTVAA